MSNSSSDLSSQDIKSKMFLKKREEPKVAKMDLHMIVKRNLPPDASSYSHEEILEELNKISHLRLDRENIKKIDSMELFGDNLTNIYLQQNRIRKIENLDFLKNIQFLSLSSNAIKEVTGLSHLMKLVFLDLSHNFIKELDVDEFPQSLAFLNLKANICTHEPNYRLSVVGHLPRLRQLDGVDVTIDERCAVGHEAPSSSEEEEEEEDVSGDEDVRNRSLDVSDIFSMTSSEILLRSQQRMESALCDHKEKRSYLADLRASTAEFIRKYGRPKDKA